MSTMTLNQEFGLMRVRFRRTLAISVGLHVLFFAWLMVNRHWAPPELPVVEITWLEQQIQPVSEAREIKPAPINEVAPQPAPQMTVREKLARNEAAAAEVRRKLAELQPSAVAQEAAARLSTTTDLRSVARATMAPMPAAAPAHLNRGTEATETAVALTRGPVASRRAPLAVADLPVEQLGTGSSESAGAAVSGAVQNLGGATITGMVADRKVMNFPMPVYPDWATDQAVEASVTLYFVVLPSGQVKGSVQVQRTAGYHDFDENAVTALRQWRFESLSASENVEQWGTITFRYRLKD